MIIDWVELKPPKMRSSSIVKVSQNAVTNLLNSVHKTGQERIFL